MHLFSRLALLVACIALANAPGHAARTILPCDADAYLDEFDQVQNQGHHDVLRVINHEPDFTHHTTALLYFDLNWLGAGATATSARLELTVKSVHPSNINGDLAVYRVTKPWLEWGCNYTSTDARIQWTNDTPWDNEYGDFVGRTGQRDVNPYAFLPGPITASAVGTVHSFDVTTLVQEWLAGTHPNHGFMLRATPPRSWELAWWAREAEDPAVRPRLVIEGTTGPRTPIELTLKPYWDRSLTRAGRVERLEVRVENPTEQPLTADVSVVVPGALEPTGPRVANGSFEADGATIIGNGSILEGNPVSGWTADSEQYTGRNVAGGPFFNNGLTPDGQNVCYLQTTVGIAQTLTGLVPGERYQLSVAANAREVGTPTVGLDVRLDGASVIGPVDIDPVGAGQPFERFEHEFTATSTTLALSIRRTGNPAGVPALLIDDVRVERILTQTVTQWSRERVWATLYNAGPFRKLRDKDANSTVGWDLGPAPAPWTGEITIRVAGFDVASAEVSLPVHLRQARADTIEPYVPDPVPAPSEKLVGMIHWPGWFVGDPIATGWSPIETHPERKPALGYYHEGDVEVIDWDIKWAVEHGIDFFAYVWYGDRQGSTGMPISPVQDDQRGYIIKDALFNARFRDRIDFALMYVYDGRYGGATQLEGIFEYMLDHYLTAPNYLVVDNKPVIFIYNPRVDILGDLGGSAADVKTYFDGWRQQAVDAGFDGLWLPFELRNANRAGLQRITAMGFDAAFPYCLGQHANGAPSEAQGIDNIMAVMESFDTWDDAPFIPTASMGWSPKPWATYTGYWDTTFGRLSWAGFEEVCQRILTLMDAQPPMDIGRRMVLLDNWNEWGEGHYMAPCRENGFEYLDAVRRTFSSAPDAHLDLLPEEVGRGPYDATYRRWLAEQDGVLLDVPPGRWTVYP